MSDLSDTSKRICDSCGKDLPDGQLFYHCRTELVAAKDETIPDLKHPDKLIAQALSEIAGKDENELLKDIYQEIILQLCPGCRAILIKLIHSMVGRNCKSCESCGPRPVKKKTGKVLQFPSRKKK